MSDDDAPIDRGLAIFAALRANAQQGEDDGEHVAEDADDTQGSHPGPMQPEDRAGVASVASEVDPPATEAAASNGGDDDTTDDGPAQAGPDLDVDDRAETGAPVPRPPMMPPEATEGLPGADRLPDLAVPEPPAARPTEAAETVADPGRRDAAGHDLPRIMAVANQKGGVGKTTTAVNLGAALAESGYRTLVVDLDPQGNASTGLGINIRDLQLSMYDVVIHEASIDDTIEATAMKNLFVAPASLDLAGAEIELVPAFSRELRLRHALAEVHDDYDYVLIDCPPSLGLLTVNGLAAAGEVLVPIQCEYYALEGLGQLLRNVALVQRNLNQQLQVSTFVCVMYDARTKLADQVVSEVRSHFGEKVCRIVVPRTVRLSEAPSYGQPILAFDPRSRGAIAYRELAREISGGARDDQP
jgi:chromosome partitioning protein